MTINIDLDDEQARRLEEQAGRLNITVSDLARAAIQDLLSRQEPDFVRAVERVLNKNADLYRRLA